MLKQRTLKTTIKATGVGLHTGDLPGDGVAEFRELAHGGLDVVTTFTLKDQRAAVSAVRSNFPTIDSRGVQVGIGLLPLLVLFPHVDRAGGRATAVGSCT